MAKKQSSSIPTVRQNSSLMSWLNKETQAEAASEVPATSTLGSEGADNNDEAIFEPEAVLPETSGSAQAENGPAEAPGEPAVIPAVRKSAELVQPVSPPVAATRKSKVKSEGSTSGQTYPELFFKKPVKPESDDVGSESRVIRISEESHWLLSVLVESARRLGNKLTAGDLIENLLANHRQAHKDEVDAYIHQWKTRKRIS